MGESERGTRTEVRSVTNAADSELAVDTESERVTAWRASELLRAGSEPIMAAELAEHGEVDLRIALELVERGCPPDLAAQILL